MVIALIEKLQAALARGDRLASVGTMAASVAQLPPTALLLAGRTPVVHGDGLQSRDYVYVADVDVVRRFHRVTGAPLGEIPISGATFLNDIAVAADGSAAIEVSSKCPPSRSGEG